MPHRTGKTGAARSRAAGRVPSRGSNNRRYTTPPTCLVNADSFAETDSRGSDGTASCRGRGHRAAMAFRVQQGSAESHHDAVDHAGGSPGRTLRRRRRGQSQRDGDRDASRSLDRHRPDAHAPRERAPRRIGVVSSSPLADGVATAHTSSMDAPKSRQSFKVRLEELEASVRVPLDKQVETKPEPSPPDAVNEEWRRQQETLRYASG